MNVPEQMRAAYIRQVGGPEVIKVGRLPVPSLGPTDVLVRMQASEVNHVDTFVRSGAYPTPLPLPFVIGRDVVGSVAAVGAGVESFGVGDPVWCNSLGHGGRQGAFAEFCTVPFERLYRLPADVSPDEAAVVLHGAGTAHIGLVREARLLPGETVFVGGGAGAVGGAAVQVAVAMGATVIASAAPADLGFCRESGAAEIVDYSAPDLYEKVRRLAPAGVDVWWDTSGHQDLASCVPLLRARGRILVTAGLRATATLPIGALYTKDVSLHGFAISNASVADLADAAVAINALLAADRLKARVGATFHLSMARDAHAAMESGTVRGRILIVP